MIVHPLVVALRVRLHTASRSDRGAAMAEYGLLLALIGLAAIGVLILFGERIADVFTEAEQTLNNSNNSEVPADG